MCCREGMQANNNINYHPAHHNNNSNSNNHQNNNSNNSNNRSAELWQQLMNSEESRRLPMLGERDAEVSYANMKDIELDGYPTEDDDMPLGSNNRVNGELSKGKEKEDTGLLHPDSNGRPVRKDSGSESVLCKGVRDFVGESDNELSFKKGDVIVILDKSEGATGWWEVICFL